MHELTAGPVADGAGSVSVLALDTLQLRAGPWPRQNPDSEKTSGAQTRSSHMPCGIPDVFLNMTTREGRPCSNAPSLSVRRVHTRAEARVLWPPGHSEKRSRHPAIPV
jgi:hypothetical protein